MAQEIKIGVGANTGAAESAVRRIDDATAGVATSVNDIASGAKAATRELERLEAATRRVAQAQAILSRETGRPVSRNDAETFLGNFDRMKRGRGLVSRRTRAYDDFEGWYRGHGSSFSRSSDAEKHRRFVMSVGMQGTEHARDYGAPPPPGGGDDGGGRPPPPQRSTFSGGVQRASSMALGFVKGGLALAGINSVMGMASSALDSATEESTGTDTLKRRMGDLGVDFDKLRNQARAAGDGLGVTYLESNRLAQHYAREAGNLGVNGSLGGERFGIGLSRAYGLESEQGVQFFGTMKRLGVAGDDSSQRKLALTIADAVARGGYGGKADEVLAAVADFSSMAARYTFSMPNVGAYTGALTALTSTGRSGLDPDGAASLLSTADSAVRRGGGGGEAGMNFIYAALRGATSDPLMSKALWSGGLFGTTQGTFGNGSSAGSYYKSMGMSTPGLSDVTNLQRIRTLVNRSIAPRYRAEVMQNLMGLSSPQQAMELLSMGDGQLGESQRLIGRAGITPKDSSIAGIASIANARSVDDLRGMYGAVMGRGDVSQAEKGRLQAVLDTGSLDDLKTALVAVVGTKEQDETEGSKTRATVVELKNELTRVGGALLGPINLIRDGIVLLANKAAPGFKSGIESGRETWARDQAASGIDFEGKIRARGKGNIDWYQTRKETLKSGYDRMKKERGGGAVDIDALAPLPNEAWKTSRDPTLQKNYEVAMALRKYIRGLENPASGHASAATVRDAAGWDRMERLAAIDGRLGMPAGTAARQLFAENRFRTAGVSPKGARGMAQIMPRTQLVLEGRLGRKLDPNNESDALLMYEEVMKENLHKFGNTPDALRAYNSGWKRSNWNNAETNAYVSNIMGNTPLPVGAGASGGGQGVNVNIGAPQEIILRDATTREQRGVVTLRPHTQPQPSGVL